MSAVVVRKFVTAWPKWVAQWHDRRMQPEHAPFVVADLGREGFLVGPYLNERYEIRDEVIQYPSFDAAAHELNLTRQDFLPMRTWVAGAVEPVLGELMDVPALVREIESAARHLVPYQRRASEEARGRCVKLYRLAMLEAMWKLLDGLGSAHGQPALSEEYKAKLRERDAFVDKAARERMAVLAATASEGESDA